MIQKPWSKRPGAADAHRLRGRRGVERRARWLSHNPLCKRCQEHNRVRLGTIVDHEVPLAKGGRDDESNFQTLCADCDREKTDEDFGRKPQQHIGIDGYPIL